MQKCRFQEVHRSKSVYAPWHFRGCNEHLVSDDHQKGTTIKSIQESPSLDQKSGTMICFPVFFVLSAIITQAQFQLKYNLAT